MAHRSPFTSAGMAQSSHLRSMEWGVPRQSRGSFWRAARLLTGSHGAGFAIERFPHLAKASPICAYKSGRSRLIALSKARCRSCSRSRASWLTQLDCDVDDPGRPLRPAFDRLAHMAVAPEPMGGGIGIADLFDGDTEQPGASRICRPTTSPWRLPCRDRSSASPKATMVCFEPSLELTTSNATLRTTLTSSRSPSPARSVVDRSSTRGRTQSRCFARSGDRRLRTSSIER